MHKNSKPIYDNSIFLIWSMSKPITIVLMMILKESARKEKRTYK